MNYTMFVSWQSDLPTVRSSLFKSIDNVANSLKEKNIKLLVDQATRDMPGSPKIEDAILEKIRKCDFFLADITPITNFSGKYIPNPNVLLELGFAIKTLGWDRIILVANRDKKGEWKPENLPFDINHHRIGFITSNKIEDLSYEIGSCLKVCHDGEPKGFLFKDNTRDPDEPTIIYQSSVVFFSVRMGQGFPGLRELQEFNNKEEIHEHLKAFFNSTLRFNKSIGDASIDPIWWFRGNKAMDIDKFSELNDNQILLSYDELNIKRVFAYSAGSGAYYRDYIYIEVFPDKPTDINNISQSEIEDYLESQNYYSEEYAVFQPTWDSPEFKISRGEYDDGAAKINGQIVDLEHRAQLRVRYLTPYNFIIAAKQSPYNCKEFQLESERYFNGILQHTIDFKEFHSFLMSLKRQDNVY